VSAAAGGERCLSPVDKVLSGLYDEVSVDTVRDGARRHHQGGELATKSAAKAHRQSLKRRLRNRAVKSATKTTVKRANVAIESGDIEAARGAVRAAISTLDRAAQKGVLHANSAARRKSRLLVKYNAAVAALQVPGEEKADEKPARKSRKSSTPKKQKK
jgi:small subunit ribosomal protein S20